MKLLNRKNLASLVDAIYRKGYLLAYGCWQLFLRVSKLRTTGTQVMITCGERVLLVRCSYRPTYSLPGGYLSGSENFVTAACREVREETGIQLNPLQLHDPQLLEHTCSGRVSRNMIFRYELSQSLGLTIDHREVVFAEFVSIRRALTLQLDDIARTSISRI